MRYVLVALTLVVASCGTQAPQRSGVDLISAGELPTAEDGDVDIAALAAFVEQNRGAEFGGAPDVQFVPSLSAGPGPPPNMFGDLDMIFLAMFDIVPPDYRLDSRELFAAGDPSGSCCPVRVVPSDVPLVTARLVVHELTHALDRRLVQGSPPIDAGLVRFRSAIAEGNARRLEESFLANFGTSVEQLRTEHPATLQLDQGVIDVLEFPYVYGRALVDAISAQGGEEAVSAALSVAPASTEQVLFPEAYFEGELPLDVVVPHSDHGRLVHFGTIGPYVLLLAVRDTLGEADALSLLRDWAGDGFELRRADGEVCLVASIVMDEITAAAELAAALSDAVTALETHALGPRIELNRCLQEG